MLARFLVSLTVVSAGFSSAWAEDKPAPYYEMRIYYAPPGRLADLQERFRKYTTKLFEKHGMTNVGYWVPIDNKENKLIYILSYPSKQAREESWKKFLADPDWKEVVKQTEAKGPIVSRIEFLFLQATDYSPAIKPAKSGDRIFELRTYITTPGNLANLHARFRDHTVKLFEKHGMANVGYWVPAAGQKDADNTLIYILAHKSVDAAKQSFDAFRKDPDWIQARKASEEKAGGSLTAKDGVKSEFLQATDYSPIR